MSWLFSALRWYQGLSGVWKVVLVFVPVILVLLGVVWYMSARAAGGDGKEAAKVLVAAVKKSVAASEKRQDALKEEVEEIDEKVQDAREEYDETVEGWKAEREAIEGANDPSDVDRIIYGDRKLRKRDGD